MRRQDTLESICLTNLKSGDFFYTHKSDKDMTARACYYDKKIKTERLLLINPQTTSIETLTKVIIL